ncbi:PfkB family carbohydrate kinase [Microbacterium sp. RURRCA19A]|uniref:PfkB family carbohydrate kinase n=1 Tax=Microbacterium sp. RURRCA19A TaxID=1907391 RepID=UPI0009543DEB|nr:PfkB family carbohydrate kinase [Microbacterium sp. RURRCA19A]SIS10873.1 pfkB family carbohydrate kinase [Microbacterium sp. RURRCA19A]
MKIVGGTYTESVVEPDSEEIMGSGMRAAAALAPHVDNLSLITAIDSELNEPVDWIATALRVNRTVVERSEPVGFRYMTPISAPLINGIGARIYDDVVVEDSFALLFGLVERHFGKRKVDASTVVLDPQKPRDTEQLQLADLSYDRLVIVANRSETLQLAREARSVSVAARLLLNASEASAVITKQGAAGCLVTWREGTSVRQETVGAHPTKRVWPIGSGDVFSAGFSFALSEGAHFVEAARIGSRSAAHWCSTQQPDVPASILRGESTGGVLNPRRAQIYLAGPFFTTGERWLIETVRDMLNSLGVVAWSPVHEVGHGDDIAEADLEGLRNSDAVLAMLDHSDAGTIFEVGWAVARDIPVVGFGRVVEKEGMKMLGGSSVELHRDLATACYRAAWAGMGMRTTSGWLT